jgi:hypothetical protein
MSRPKIKRRDKWNRVTNELVCAFAVDDCPRCGGTGVIDKDTMPHVCKCADIPFKEAYAGRLRRHGSGRLEFREVAMDVVP